MVSTRYQRIQFKIFDKAVIRSDRCDWVVLPAMEAEYEHTSRSSRGIQWCSLIGKSFIALLLVICAIALLFICILPPYLVFATLSERLAKPPNLEVYSSLNFERSGGTGF